MNFLGENKNFIWQENHEKKDLLFQIGFDIKFAKTIVGPNITVADQTLNPKIFININPAGTDHIKPRSKI